MTTRIDVIGGVDTHGRTHHAAVINSVTGKLLGDHEFPATSAGYRQLLAWSASFGTVLAIGVEGTGSFVANLFRFLHAEQIRVLEVTRPNRQQRRMHGKSDPIDAIAAARAVLAETATATPKLRTGPIESIRLIRTTRASAVKARRAAINQMHALIWTAPDPLRDTLTGARRAALVTRCARLRLDRTNATHPAAATKAMLRRLARRVQALDEEITAANHELAALIAEHAPRTRAVFGAGDHTAAQLLTAVGDNPDRVTSERALARLCGVAPIPASSGNTQRHRLHRGGDRQANNALYLIVLNRLRWHQPTRDYVTRHTAEGKTKKEIIRCLKRYIAREIYATLRADLKSLSITP